MKNEAEESKEFVVFKNRVNLRWKMKQKSQKSLLCFVIVKSKYKERKDEIETWERETVEKLKAACRSPKLRDEEMRGREWESWRDERRETWEAKMRKGIESLGF